MAAKTTTKAKPKAKQRTPAQQKMAAFDSFQNQLARLGAGTNNIMNSTEYVMTRITRQYNLLNTLYRNSWICKKIVNRIPEDMCKNWISLTAELKPETQDRYDKLEKKTKIRSKIIEGLYWGRLYGGAAALILIDGHENILDEPLELDDINPGAFKGLMIIDRWSGIYPDVELITDISDPEFGDYKYYEVRNVYGGLVQRVHHTRLIKFEGRKLPFWENLLEVGWGASELEHVFDELQKRDNTSWNIASLIFQANVLVNKVEGMDQMLALTDTQTQSDFYNIKKAQNEMRNNSSMLLIGKEEEISALQYTFGGINDIYESFMLDICGAAEIPATILFGRSPAGMNSTGESDMQIYYDMIGQQQNSVLSPKLDKLLPIMFMSEFGDVPDDLGHKFNPVKTPSDQEAADLVGKKVDSIDKVYNSGILNRKQSLQELHELSYTSNMFSSITNEDIEEAEETYNDEGTGMETESGGEVDESAGMGEKQASRTQVQEQPAGNKKDDNAGDK